MLGVVMLNVAASKKARENVLNIETMTNNIRSSPTDRLTNLSLNIPDKVFLQKGREEGGEGGRGWAERGSGRSNWCQLNCLSRGQ
jgi:hypothetical protein